MGLGFGLLVFALVWLLSDWIGIAFYEFECQWVLVFWVCPFELDSRLCQTFFDCMRNNAIVSREVETPSFVESLIIWVSSYFFLFKSPTRICSLCKTVLSYRWGVFHDNCSDCCWFYLPVLILKHSLSIGNDSVGLRIHIAWIAHFILPRMVVVNYHRLHVLRRDALVVSLLLLFGWSW